MKVSEHFKLGLTQPSLDFVDVEVDGDIPLFVDPAALRSIDSDWAHDCIAIIESFFACLLAAARRKDNAALSSLLNVLREPNDVHLGWSSGPPKGRAIGAVYAKKIANNLKKSRAVATGHLRDIEDTVLMIEGIASDRLSDMTIGIIRGPLIEYTQSMCGYYDIPMSPSVDSGRMWDVQNDRWFSELVPLPVVNDTRLVLIPKFIVRRKIAYDVSEYYRHYVLTDLQADHLAKNSALVEVLKNKKRRVTKKSLIKRYGQGKLAAVKQTIAKPELLDRYRDAKRQTVTEPLRHEAIAEAEREINLRPNWAALAANLQDTPSGQRGATQFESAIEAILSAAFYPYLVNPEKQVAIHNRRKIVDITFDNVAVRGFFHWLRLHYPAAKVIIECKNYSGDPANPELDQLSGRFSPRRGRFGILICRSIAEKERFAQRCRDTADDDRGFIIALDDVDILNVIDWISRGQHQRFNAFLRDKFDLLIM